MKNYRFITGSLSMLRQHQPVRLMLIFLLTLIMGVTSGFSFVLLIPLLQIMNIGSQPENGLALFFSNLSENTGITLNIETILLTFVIILTLNAFLQYWKALMESQYQQSFIYQLRRRIFRKIVLADWPLLNSESRANHLQVLTREVPNVSYYYYYYLQLATTSLMAVTYTVYALMVSFRFTMLIILVGVVLFFLLRKFLFRAFHLGSGFVSSYNRLVKYIDDFWDTVKIAKVHSSEEFHYRRFEKASSSLLDMEIKIRKNNSLPELIYRIAGIVVLVLIVYAGYRVDQVPLSSFFVLILLFSRIYPQFVGINTDMNMLMSNMASVRMVMDLEAEFKDKDFPVKTAGDVLTAEKEIRLDNLKFSYPGRDDLFNVFSETVPAGRITGVIGESGRGKTTLIDIIAGLQRPAEGKIIVDGRPLTDDLLPLWRAGIGYLPQESFFIDGTLRDTLLWDSTGITSDEEIMKVLGQVNALHLVKRFRKGLDAYIVNYHYSFSGGECQRLALARVLLRKPRLLLLDEATSSLDVDNEALIMEVIKKLEDITIIFVTHRTSLLPYFDKVIRL